MELKFQVLPLTVMLDAARARLQLLCHTVFSTCEQMKKKFRAPLFFPIGRRNVFSPAANRRWRINGKAKEGNHT